MINSSAYASPSHNSAKFFLGIGSHSLDTVFDTLSSDELATSSRLNSSPVSDTKAAKASIPHSDQLLDACKRGDMQAIKRLLKTSVSADTRDHQGSTVLAIAAMNGHAQSVDFLAQHVRSLNSRSGAYHRTALHLAAINQQFDTVLVLALRGARLNTSDRSGSHCLDSLSNAQREKLADCLQQAQSLVNNDPAHSKLAKRYRAGLRAIKSYEQKVV